MEQANKKVIPKHNKTYQFTNLDGYHGGLQVKQSRTKPNPNKKLYKYDRTSFYATEILKLKEIPSFASIKRAIPIKPLAEPTVKGFKKMKFNNPFVIIEFDIRAVRKLDRRGIYFAWQKEIVSEKNACMFFNEFRKIFLNEFDIISIKNIRFLQPSFKPIDPTLRQAIDSKLNQKMMADEKLIKIKKEYGVNSKSYLSQVAKRTNIKERLIHTIVNSSKHTNRGFDSLSLVYLQSVCRLKMFKEIEKNSDTFVSAFVDELVFTEPKPEYEKDKEWRNSSE